MNDSFFLVFFSGTAPFFALGLTCAVASLSSFSSELTKSIKTGSFSGFLTGFLVVFRSCFWALLSDLRSFLQELKMCLNSRFCALLLFFAKGDGSLSSLDRGRSRLSLSSLPGDFGIFSSLSEVVWPSYRFLQLFCQGRRQMHFLCGPVHQWRRKSNCFRGHHQILA